MKKGLLLSLLILLTASSWSQSTTPFTFNSSGGSYTNSSSYQFEWSIGEATIINDLVSPDKSCILLNGVLQPGSERPDYPYTVTFSDGDYRLFPNPTAGRFELDFFITHSGNMQLQVNDVSGRILKTMNYHYDGTRRIQLFDLGTFANGLYFITATLTPDNNGQLDNTKDIRRSTFKVIKAN